MVARYLHDKPPPGFQIKEFDFTPEELVSIQLYGLFMPIGRENEVCALRVSFCYEGASNRVLRVSRYDGMKEGSAACLRFQNVYCVGGYG